MQLLVLASGRGSRLQKLTEKNPKCMVKIRNRSLIQILSDCFYKFNEVIIVAGYKSSKVKKYNFSNKIKIIKNKKYMNTNMVFSMFEARKLVREDVLITYSDIVFDHSILDKMKILKYSHIPVNLNWLKYWKKRMPLNKIKNDAEDLIIKKRVVKKIGTKIGKKFPIGQFMGLIMLKSKDYHKLYKYFKYINNKKIDMTNFLNLAIKNKKLSLQSFKTRKYWFEIDNKKDLKLANKEVKY